MECCKICDKEFKNIRSLVAHIVNSKSHNISPKNYYDKFFRKENEGVCKVYGKETKYMGFTYLIYCSHKCYSLDPDIRNIRSESNRQRIVSEETRKLMKDCRTKWWKDPNCKGRDPEVQKRKGKKIKEKWEDPESIFNSKEFKEEISNIMKELWKNPDCIWRSREFLDQVVPKRKEWMLNGGSDYLNSFPRDPEKLKKETKRKQQWMVNGGSAYILSFVKNPSKPQVELYNRVKELYQSAELNFPCFELNYSLDVAIPDLKIWFESDGSYWHQDKEKDLERQRKIENLGWKCIRYVANTINQVPSIEQIKNDIDIISKEINPE